MMANDVMLQADCYRGFAHTSAEEKQALLRQYKNGRPIQCVRCHSCLGLDYPPA